MIKNVTLLEVKKGERVYQLSLSNDSPLGELFDVISEIRAFVYEKIKAINTEEAKKEETPEQPEETKVEDVSKQ